MQIFLFFALFIAVIAVVFAIQNTSPTTVSFITWKFNGSVALVLLIALAAGALIIDVHKNLLRLENDMATEKTYPRTTG